MSSERLRSLPAIASGRFKRSLLGYRRRQVDAALGAVETELATHNLELERARDALPRWHAALAVRDQRIAGLDEVVRQLSSAVVERDRELRELRAMREQLMEISAQARGQATRIRMQALRQAVALAASGGDVRDMPVVEAGAAEPATARGIGSVDTFEGTVQMEVGPLRDFSQLVSFEDAVTGIGSAREISVRRFSQGRATLALRLDEPTELLRELEQRTPFEITVRSLRDDRLIVDVDQADAA